MGIVNITSRKDRTSDQIMVLCRYTCFDVAGMRLGYGAVECEGMNT